MVVIFLALLAFQPAFEVASVKPSAPDARVMNALLAYPGGRIMARGCWLSYLVQQAFDVQAFQITGGPGWMRQDRFDIDARPPAGSKSIRANPSNAKLPMNDEQRQMMQALLAERFQLKVHRAAREGAVYFLVKTNKKLKLAPAKNKNDYPWAGSPQGGGIAGENITMAQFATRLSGFFERPVIDRTGLDGAYDFKYVYAPGEVNVGLASIVAGVQELGLKLESGKGPVETIVIDHAEKPSEN